MAEHQDADKQIVLGSVNSMITMYDELYDVMGEDDFTTIENVLKVLNEFKQVLQTLTSNTEIFYNSYTASFVPVLDKLLISAKEVQRYGEQNFDLRMTRDASELQNKITIIAENMISFVLSQDEDFLAPIEKSLPEVAIEAEELSYLAGLDGGQELHAKFFAEYSDFTNITKSLYDSAFDIVKLRKQVPELEKYVSDETATLSAEATAEATAVFNAIFERTQEETNLILIISSIVLALSIVISLYLVKNLANTLNKMASYASYIANGEFNRDSNITEQGEVGLVVGSMEEIANVLKDLIAKCRKNANDVSMGQLDAKMDLQDFNNEYKNLASVINVISSSFITHIENLPGGLFTADKNRRVMFMNRSGKKLVSEENVIGKFCGDLFRSPACESEATCLGCNSVAKKGDLNGEAMCYPKGNELVLDVYTNPLKDLDGNITGYMEILNDITQIKQQTNAIKTMSEQANGVAIRVASAAEELSAQTESLVQGSNLQKDRIESTSAAMTQMNASVIEVAKNADITTQQSENVRQKAREGIVTLGKMTDSMEALSTSSSNLKNNMAELDELAEGIDSIINVITDIADQTNLLALNAAIEAARAGEAGRGFAVVADEVRKLAEKPMSATSEVDKSIRAIQNSSRANQQEVTNVVENIVHTAELAQESETSLQEIVHFTEQTSEMIINISTAAQEQSNTSNEISKAMLDINETVNTTTEAVMQSAEAVRELTQQAQELQSYISQVNN